MCVVGCLKVELTVNVNTIDCWIMCDLIVIVNLIIVQCISTTAAPTMATTGPTSSPTLSPIILAVQNEGKTCVDMVLAIPKLKNYYGTSFVSLIRRCLYVDPLSYQDDTTLCFLSIAAYLITLMAFHVSSRDVAIITSDFSAWRYRVLDVLSHYLITQLYM